MTGVQTCALPICFPVTIGDGVSDSVFGERVEPDGYDERGGPSWLMAMGIC